MDVSFPPTSSKLGVGPVVLDDELGAGSRWAGSGRSLPKVTSDCETSARERRIVCVGQLSVDTVVTLAGSFAIRDQCVGSFATRPGGTASIVAHNVAVLGGAPVFTGHVGCCEEDRLAAARLRRAGVVFGSTVTSACGLRVLIVVDADGERTMISNGAEPDWASLVVDFVAGDVVFFEGWHLYDPDVRQAYISLINVASLVGAVVVLDVCSAARGTRPEELSALLRALPLDVVLANEAEARVYELVSAPPSAVVVVHRGASSTCVLVSGVRSEVSVAPVAPLDTTGAGDTFAAGFLLALSRGADPISAASSGNSAAALAVQVPGALLPAVPSSAMAPTA